MPKLKLSSLIIGGIINLIVVSILDSYDSRLATIYTILLFIIIMVTYRDEIFPSINSLFSTIQRGINE